MICASFPDINLQHHIITQLWRSGTSLGNSMSQNVLVQLCFHFYGLKPLNWWGWDKGMWPRFCCGSTRARPFGEGGSFSVWQHGFSTCVSFGILMAVTWELFCSCELLISDDNDERKEAWDSFTIWTWYLLVPPTKPVNQTTLKSLNQPSLQWALWED